MTVFELFRGAAERWGGRALLSVTEGTAAAYGIAAGDISYAAALDDVLRLRDAYRSAGYGGHRVGLLMENRPATFLHFFALNALGCSVVPLNPDLRVIELSYVIAHSDMAAIAAIPVRHAALREAAGERSVPVSAPDEAPAPVPPCAAPVADEAALLYTSGTTGRPKGCVLPNRYFTMAGEWYASLGGLGALRPGEERMLTPLPLFHMNALAYSAMAMLATGGCLVPLDRFHPRSWWRTVRDSRATVVHYLGVMPAILMADPPSPDDRAHGVRFGFGAGVDPKLHAPFEERFGFPLIEAWAMTETGAGAVVAASTEPRHMGTACFGRPAPDIETRIVAEDGTGTTQGELLVRHAGPDPRAGFFREYLKDPGATAEAWDGGWFHTGDVVRRGPDGSLHFIDRRKNVIRRSGENIASVEVESALRQHPAVTAVAVAPVADPIRGEEVFACIVTTGEPTEALAQQITAWCVARLAYYKAPGHIAFVEDLPLTSTQKIQRGELRALVASLAATAHDTRAWKRRT
jgi:acyl-CoA synthetase (AMP-forming)/AMP-acid ligase II